LNKKVLYDKTTDKVNSKIVNMKHRVSICNKSDYLDKINQVSQVNDLLSESRKLNDDFYKKVIEIFDKFIK
jgi:hypothetical protein